MNLRIKSISIALFCLAPYIWAQNLPQGIEGYVPANTAEQLKIVNHEKVRNIILLIGDGMSIATVSHARLRGAGVKGKLHMDRMPIAGFVRTASADRLITDSAAASSAMACGVKTHNGMISTQPDEKIHLTIMEACQKTGMMAGLVATSSITHATPAGFAAHTLNRKEEPTIAEHLLENKIDVLLGGGQAFFTPQSEKGSQRKDDRDLIAEAKAAGYHYVDNLASLTQANTGPLLGLFAEEGMNTQRPEPTLKEMTAKAIALLNNKRDGFILMVEGSQIDWANHDNNAEESARQTILFDQAVEVALDFALQDKHTLVIVVADHETGGMVINGGSPDGQKLDIKWTSNGHTGATVPLYGYGPGAQRLSGFHENTDIPRVFAELLGIRPFPIEKQL